MIAESDDKFVTHYMKWGNTDLISTRLKFIAELHAQARSARVGGAPLLRKSTHPRKFGNHVTDRPTVRPHHRHTNVYSHTF